MDNFLNGGLEGVFSIAVAAFLLLRMETKLEVLNKTLTELLLAVKELKK